MKFYEPLEAYEGNCYDGLIVTGAPVEHLRFEDVDYWDEFKRVLDLSSTHVFSTMYMCWGAMAALYQRYGVHKMDLDEKLFGVFPQFLQDEYCFLTNGFDEIALQPHSRLAGVNEADIAANPELQVLTWGPQAWPRADRHAGFFGGLRTRALGVRQVHAGGGIPARYGEGHEQCAVPAQLFPERRPCLGPTVLLARACEPVVAQLAQLGIPDNPVRSVRGSTAACRTQTRHRPFDSTRPLLAAR